MTKDDKTFAWITAFFVGSWLLGTAYGAEAALYGGLVIGLLWLLFFAFWMSGRKQTLFRITTNETAHRSKLNVCGGDCCDIVYRLFRYKEASMTEAILSVSKQLPRKSFTRMH